MNQIFNLPNSQYPAVTARRKPDVLRRHLRHRLFILFLGITALMGAQASVDMSLYQDMHWRLVGPFRGGRVLTVTGVPGDDRHFWFGAVDGGVWATQDAGRSWQPIFDSQPVGSIGALAVVNSNPDIIYVGTGETDMRSDIAHGDGMYKTIDAGQHWTHIGLHDTRQISKVLVDPRNPEVVWVAALGHAYGANAQRGVFRSTNGGKTWSKVLFRDDATGAIDLAFKPGDPDTIYAALWQTRRPPWSVYPPANGPGSGLFVSHDGGSHWKPMRGNGFPAHPGRIGVALSPAQPDRVYALVDAVGGEGEGGLYRSDDNGEHWKHVSDDPRIWKRGWYFGRLTVDPKNAERIYVMNTIVLRSDDGGKQFMALKGDPTGDDFHQMWIDPSNTERQILGVDQGTLITLNGGKTWSSWHNQPTAQIYHLSTDNRYPYWIYATQQDSGALALPSRTSSSDGITMEQFREVSAGGERGMIVADPDDHDIIYGDTVRKLNLRTWQTRNIDPTLAYPDTHYRSTWTLPLVFSRQGPKTLYFANQRLFRTLDGGDHWAPISPDLSREDAGTPANLDAVTAADDYHIGKRRGVIYTIAPSPLAARALWVGTDDGLVWRSADGGTHWQKVTPAALTPWSKVAGIELSHFDGKVAYLAIDRHRLDDDSPYIYRSSDNGASWVRIDAGIPRDSFVNVVREDPKNKDLLYAGTEKGMYLSFDAGAHWQSLQQNLPTTSVRDIEVHDNDLVIATHGRGIWIMDDVSALRQVHSVRTGEVTLFRPAAAIRSRLAGFTGTPLPRDEPKAANPPNGAYIDYILPASVKGEVTLSVLDAQNQVIRSYSSAVQAPESDPTKLGYAPEWVQVPVQLSALPGMHRMVWDMHYTTQKPAHQEASRFGQNRGVWAPPGHYSIELKAAGRSYRQPLLLLPDPRVKLPAGALQREFILARKVEAASAQALETLARASKLLKALRGQQNHANAALRERFSDLMAAAADLSGVQLDVDPRNSMGSPPKRTDSLRAVSMKLQKLENAIDGADNDPSTDVLTAWTRLARTLDTTLAAWKQLEHKDLGALNTQLKATGGQAIVL